MSMKPVVHSLIVVWASLLRVVPLTLAVVPAVAQDPTQPPDATTRDDQPAQVRIEKTDTGFRMLRNGAPYTIRGAGGRRYMAQLAEAGGNSIRTWHARGMRATLDRAHELGLSVTYGMWLGHERHGFDYSNPQSIAKVTAEIREAVLTHRDHPALLMWGIGNEMEGDGSNPLIWKTVNDIAGLVKQLDPHHPTMTVIAGTGNNKVAQLIKHCPNIDVIGINQYGDLRQIPVELKRQGLDRPYVITEFGPFGWWQVEKTPWGAELEPTSTAKAITYRQSYAAAVTAQPGWCLGAYAFLWGDKQEHTRTWFGMFLPNGEQTAAVEVMTHAWTGAWPANRCPRLEGFVIELLEGQRVPGHDKNIFGKHVVLQCVADAHDSDGDALQFRWELRSESTDRRSGGDREEAPPAHPDAILSVKDSTMTLTTGEREGAFRVFVYVSDGHHHAATANIPIFIR
jgi:hypothetical protein